MDMPMYYTVPDEAPEDPIGHFEPAPLDGPEDPSAAAPAPADEQNPTAPEEAVSTEEMLPAEETEALLSLQARALEVARRQGGYEDMLYAAAVAMLGEVAFAPRVSRQGATPRWCVGTCPGCSRVLHLLAVPSLDVGQCIYCGAWMFATAPNAFAKWQVPPVSRQPLAATSSKFHGPVK